MASTTTIARPYARAVFELARERNALERWSETLARLALIARDPVMQAAFGNPRVPPHELAAIVIDVAGVRDAAECNLIRLLAERKRLALLPEIARAYEALRAEAERTIEVELRAASEVPPTLQERFIQALKQRLGREVKLKVVKDEQLIGGAVVRAGDLVIDASVRGKLERLAAEMTH